MASPRPAGRGPQVEHDVADPAGHAEQPQAGQGEVQKRQGPSLVGGAAGEGGHGIDQSGEVGGDGPGRPRVTGLEHERRQPREKRHTAHGQRSQRRPRPTATRHGAPPRLPRQPQGGHPDEVQRPVLAVEQQRDRDGHADEVAHGGAFERTLQSHQTRRRQKGDEGVHPVLGGVLNGKGRGGDEDEGADGHGPTAYATPGDPHERQGGAAQHAGQGADGDVGGAHRHDPVVQHDVVQRRCAVTLQGSGDLVDGQAGDVEGERLVEPHVGAGPEAQDDPDGDGADGPDDEQADEPCRGDPGRVGIAGKGAGRCRGLGRGDRSTRHHRGPARRRAHVDR